MSKKSKKKQGKIKHSSKLPAFKAVCEGANGGIKSISFTKDSWLGEEYNFQCSKEQQP
jgi:hypothetical protein